MIVKVEKIKLTVDGHDVDGSMAAAKKVFAKLIDRQPWRCSTLVNGLRCLRSRNPHTDRYGGTHHMTIVDVWPRHS